ncbi:MAG: (deoxy)nucleoside triphosphate pyrophosphohydrolase [Actinomycetota bacterium]|nr:(deoxy)nucleoside triphosphate pyrophosphohydrolase [Actinomycetota bacterium]
MEAPVVVGAAIVDRRGTTRVVLAAERSEPPHLAGCWEFPGGKVEVGETPEQACVRECREELGVEIELGARLGTDVAIGDGATVLRVWLATLAGGHPAALQHRQLRWLAASELGDLEWLAADLPLVAALRAHLVGTDPG